MKILVIGSNGLLGQKVSTLLANETNFDVLLSSIEYENFLKDIRFNYNQLDVTIRSDVKSIIKCFKPDVIINTAAFTNVDECENQREYAWRLNVDAVKHLIIGARLTGSKIIHISTDYIFDGKNGPYTEQDMPNPISYYGRTKLASENALKASGIDYCIIRTMILYGLGKRVRPNFVLWVIKNLQNNIPIKVVTDQIGNPTLVDDLAYAILKIIKGNRSGIYNICGADRISRYDFAKKIASIFKLNQLLIKPVLTSDFAQIAPRPLNSGLTCFKATSEMGIKFLGVEQGLYVLKKQIEIEGFINK